MDYNFNSGEFYKAFNDAVNDYVAKNDGGLADKFYVHILKDGSYEINAEAKGGIAIDRKLAKYARAHLKDIVGVQSENIKNLYMKRSIFKKISERRTKQDELISNISGIIKKESKAAVKKGEMERLVTDSGLFSHRILGARYIQPATIALRMSRLLESEPDLVEEIDKTQNKNTLISLLFKATLIITDSSYSDIDVAVNTDAYQIETGGFYNNTVEAMKQLRDHEEYDIGNLPENLSNFIEFLRAANEIYSK